MRRLSVLAFLSPKILDAIADRRAPAELTVSALTETLPLHWTRQEAIFFRS